MASIYQRGLTWWISYYDNGQLIQKSLKTRDKTVAKFKKNELENQLAKGDSPIPDFNQSPVSVLEEYKEFCKHRNKSHTIVDDAIRIKDFLDWAQPARIKDINESLVLSYVNHRLDKKEIILSTANHIITNLKTFLNYAVSKRYLSQNQIKKIKRFKVDKVPPRFLSKAEILEVLKAAEKQSIYSMVATAIYSGVRLGELKRLTWEDIDFTRGEIMIRLSKPGKFRVVPLHPSLRKILHPIAQKRGSCFNFQNIRRIFREVCLDSGNYHEIASETQRKNGIKYKFKKKVVNIGWHTFRHTFASQLIMSGVDIVTVSKLLGHASISTTMIYSHLSQEHLKESIKSLQF